MEFRWQTTLNFKQLVHVLLLYVFFSNYAKRKCIGNKKKNKLQICLAHVLINIKNIYVLYNLCFTCFLRAIQNRSSIINRSCEISLIRLYWKRVTIMKVWKRMEFSTFPESLYFSVALKPTFVPSQCTYISHMGLESFFSTKSKEKAILVTTFIVVR